MLVVAPFLFQYLVSTTRCLQLRGRKYFGRDSVEGIPADQPGRLARLPQQHLHPSPPRSHPDPQYGSEVTNG